MLEPEVRHANVWFSRHATNPLKTWHYMNLPCSGHEADFSNSFRIFRPTFLQDSSGNAGCPWDLSLFIVLICSVISAGAGKSLQTLIRNPYAMEEMWFEFPQAVEGMGCGSPSFSMGALIPINCQCVYATICALLCLTRSNPFWGGQAEEWLFYSSD